jgi:hypothetical protein
MKRFLMVILSLALATTSVSCGGADKTEATEGDSGGRGLHGRRSGTT